MPISKTQKYSVYNKEKKQILTFDKLEPVNDFSILFNVDLLIISALWATFNKHFLFIFWRLQQPVIDPDNLQRRKFNIWNPSASFSPLLHPAVSSSPLRLHGLNTDMASAQSEQSSVLQEELTCPVCLDLYRDPHLLPCGHNFCKTCLDRLKRQADRGRFRCPECRDSHRCGTNFQKNFKLANIADDYRHRRRATTLAATALKSRELLTSSLPSQQARSVFAVPCDYCPSVAAEASGTSGDGPSVSQEGGDKQEPAAAAASMFAVKTCLKCEVSMCQEHVKPHLELPAFREHPLTEPMNDFWKRKCPDHDEIYRYEACEHIYCSVNILKRWVCFSCCHKVLI